MNDFPAGWATIILAVIALVALGAAYRQVTSARKNQREANADALWRSYLRLAFRHPKFADPGLEPHLARFDYEALTINGDPELFQQYEWFVDFVLDSCERVLELDSSEEWNETVRTQLDFHWDYLHSDHYQHSGYLLHHKRKFRELIQDVLSHPPRRRRWGTGAAQEGRSG